jgi:hypothetical protein
MVLTVDRMMAPNAPLKTPKPVNVNGFGEAWDPDHPSFRGVNLVKTPQLTDEVTKLCLNRPRQTLA